jgi:hypothetical protein
MTTIPLQQKDERKHDRSRSRSRSPPSRRDVGKKDKLKKVAWREIQSLPAEARPHSMRLYRLVKLKGNADYIAFAIASQVPRAADAGVPHPPVEAAFQTSDGKVVRPMAVVHINGDNAEKSVACVIAQESLSAADREFLLSHRSISEKDREDFAEGTPLQKILRRAIVDMLQVAHTPEFLSKTSFVFAEGGISARVTNSYFCNEPVLMHDEVSGLIAFVTVDA